MSDYRADYRDKIKAGLKLPDVVEPDNLDDPNLIPFMGAQVGWSPRRESGKSGEVEVIAPDGLPATIKGVCSECGDAWAGDPLSRRGVCIGCLRARER